MPTELIEFWQNFTFASPPFAHPEDLAILRENGRRLIEDDPSDFEDFLAGPRFGNENDDRLHLSLLPVPYVGDLRQAPIVILMLNPGFEYSDYWAEYKVPDFRKRLKENLIQSLDGTEYPFLYLDPQFCWHSGFMWWEKKLRDVIRTIARKKFDHNYRAALRDVSQKLACIELIPYHSVSFNDHKLIDRLPSVQKAREFVQATLVPDAKLHKRTVIVTRQVKGWGLQSGADNNVVVYEGGHTRGASLSTNSAGGKAILDHYAIK